MRFPCRGLTLGFAPLVAAAIAGPASGQATFELLAANIPDDATDDATILVGGMGGGTGSCSDTAPVQPGRWTRETDWSWLVGICASWVGAGKAVSRDGAVIGGTCRDASNYVEFMFLWTGPDQSVKLPDPLTGDVPWDESRNAANFHMSRNGLIVCTSTNVLGQGPMRWTAETGWEKLLLDGEWIYGQADAVADDGTVVGFIGSLPSPVQAFRSTPGAGTTALPIPAGFTDSAARVVTVDGRVVLGWASAGFGASNLVRWLPDGTSQVPGAIVTGGKFRSTYVDVTSAEGNLVAGHWNESGTSSEPAFIWNARDGIRDLRDLLVTDYGVDVRGFRVKNPVMMSEDGRRIVGGEANHAWLVTLPAYCRPDCNADGNLTVNDFLCFQARWRAQDIYGDFNNDGKFNVNDFIAFQAEWRRVRDGGGCE